MKGNIRYYNAGYDNCLQCCLAGLLDIEISETFDVNMLDKDGQENWFKYTNVWLKAKHKKVLTLFKPDEECNSVNISVYVTVDNPDGAHAVIEDENGNEVHDPFQSHPIKDKLLYRMVLTDLVEEVK